MVQNFLIKFLKCLIIVHIRLFFYFKVHKNIITLIQFNKRIIVNLVPTRLLDLFKNSRFLETARLLGTLGENLNPHCVISNDLAESVDVTF